MDEGKGVTVSPMKDESHLMDPSGLLSNLSQMTDKESVVDNLGKDERGKRNGRDRCDGQVREPKMDRQRKGGWDSGGERDRRGNVGEVRREKGREMEVGGKTG